MTDPPNSRQFPPTQWTTVKSLHSQEPEKAAAALETLCQRYWPPIYAYLRRTGRSPHDAEDLTQVFFAQLVANHALSEARPERGKLRSYLLAMLVRMLHKEDRRDRAQKRGGEAIRISLDATGFEAAGEAELASREDPETLYLRSWARCVLQAARESLREDFERLGRLPVFDLLAPYLFHEEDKPPYPELATALDSSQSAVRLLLHRLRKQFRNRLEEELSRTVSSLEELQEELAWLKKTLASD